MAQCFYFGTVGVLSQIAWSISQMFHAGRICEFSFEPRSPDVPKREKIGILYPGGQIGVVMLFPTDVHPLTRVKKNQENFEQKQLEWIPVFVLKILFIYGFFFFFFFWTFLLVRMMEIFKWPHFSFLYRFGFGRHLIWYMMMRMQKQYFRQFVIAFPVSKAWTAPQASGAPADFTQKGGGRGLSSPLQTCWIFNEPFWWFSLRITNPSCAHVFLWKIHSGQVSAWEKGLNKQTNKKNESHVCFLKRLIKNLICPPGGLLRP